MADKLRAGTTVPSMRTVLWRPTLLNAFIFLGMTGDSLRKMGARTHADQLSAKVVEGKWRWQLRPENLPVRASTQQA